MHCRLHDGKPRTVLFQDSGGECYFRTEMHDTMPSLLRTAGTTLDLNTSIQSPKHDRTTTPADSQNALS